MGDALVIPTKPTAIRYKPKAVSGLIVAEKIHWTSSREAVDSFREKKEPLANPFLFRSAPTNKEKSYIYQHLWNNPSSRSTSETDNQTSVHGKPRCLQ